MKDLILALILIVPLQAATGDITGVSASNWYTRVYMSGLATNGTFLSGFESNNIPTSAAKMRLRVDTLGYDSTGTAVVRQRTLFGTERIRIPTTNFPDVEIVGSDAMLKVGTSEFVYGSDSNLVADFIGGLYTSGGNPSLAASSVTVTNTSDSAFPRVIGNWQWPGYYVLTNNTVRLRAFAVQGHATQGKPVALMRFITTGATSGVKVTNDVTSLSVDQDMAVWFNGTRAPLFGEYIADVDLTPFNNQEELRHDFIAYPWIGNASAVLDTTLNEFQSLSGHPQSMTNLLDKLNTYSRAMAVCSPTGTNATGRVYTNVTDATSIPASDHFLEISAAVTAVTATNNAVYGHNDAGGAVIFLKAGLTNWMGGTHSVTAVPKAAITFKPYPGDTVTLTTRNTTRDAGGRMRFDGVSFNWSSGNIPFSGTTFLHIDNSPSVVSASSATHNMPTGPGVVWYTRSFVGSCAQGMRANAVADNISFMLRSCIFDGFTQNFHGLMTAGIFVTNGAGFNVALDRISGQGTPYGMCYVYNSIFYAQTSVTTEALTMGKAVCITNGMALVQCIFEKGGTPHNPGPLGLMNSIPEGGTNLLVISSYIGGQRIADIGPGATDDSGGGRSLWIRRETITDGDGFKKDDVVTVSSNRLFGSGSIYWTVGWKKNFFLSPNISSIQPPSFAGMVTYHTAGPPPPSSSVTNNIDLVRHVNRAGNPISATGGGNYRLQSHSPGFWLRGGDWCLAFDIEGNPRGASDGPGPYATGNTRRGGLF